MTEDATAAATHLDDAIAHERTGHLCLMAGNGTGGREAMARAAESYWASWQTAPPAAIGRLVGMLKASVIAGDATLAARKTLRELPRAASPSGAYARALAHLVLGDDAQAKTDVAALSDAGPAFARTGGAIDALAARDGTRYADALRAIITDFELREAHLTGVAIADTAVMLEILAESRGLALHPQSPCLPA